MQDKRPNTKRYSPRELGATAIICMVVYLASVGLCYTIGDGLEFINDRLEARQSQN